MMHGINKFMLWAILIFSVFCLAMFVGYKSTNAEPAKNPNADKVCEGVGAISGDTDCDPKASTTVNKLIKNIINLLSWGIGVISVIVVMLGGFSIITANGDAAKVTKGRQMVMYALVGLVVVALSQVIVKFVLNKVI